VIPYAAEMDTEETNDLIYSKSHSDRVNDSEISEELILKLSEVIKGQKLIGDMMKKNGEILTEITDLLINPTNK
jgi:hypothetical protein